MFRVNNYVKESKFIFKSIKESLYPTNASRFRRNFINVAKANFLAQILTLFASPLITRLYSPEDFGTFSLFSSLLGMLLAFSSLRFDWSIPNAKSRIQAVTLLFIGFLALIIVSTTTFVVLWFFGSDWTFWQGFQVLGPYLLLLPIALVGGGLHQLLQAWFVREANLTAVSRTKITQSVVGTGLNIAGGILQMGVLGLIFSSVVAAWVGIVTLLRQANGLRNGLFRLSIIKIKVVWLRFWRESVFSSLVAIINTASLMITPILLAQFYKPVEVGWYALMLRLAITPIGLFTSAVGQSFWAEAASLVRSDHAKLRMLYLRLSKNMVLLAIPLIVFCLLGPLYTGFVFGEEWNNAGYILAALTPLLVGQLVVSPLSHLVVHRKQHWQFLWDFCRFALLFTALFTTGAAQWPISLTVLFASSVMLLMYAILFGLNLRNLEIST